MQDLARMSLVKSANKNSVDYNDLANIVDQQETLQFLQGIPVFYTCNTANQISVTLLHGLVLTFLFSPYSALPQFTWFCLHFTKTSNLHLAY